MDARRIAMIICALVAIGSLSYFAIYNYQLTHNTSMSEELLTAKDNNFVLIPRAKVNLNNTDTPDVLEEYASVYELNKSLVGWIRIDDTKVDYPVMQTKNNDYYLDHNFNQEKDNNGSIFIDKDCSIFPRSQNLIIYGHNMKSGKMFGTLKEYKNISYFEKHPDIQFDSIYEKGTYKIMYVFSDIVYDQSEIAFKYYQFINANSETEYNSYMNEMAAKSLYDTGVTSVYGDALITLSTCDYTQDSERFVIVAKKIN